MLTAEINNQPINCYDNKYDRDTLKNGRTKEFCNVLFVMGSMNIVMANW